MPDSLSASYSSSCSEVLTDPLGRQSIAVDTPGGGGDNYPFVGDSDIDKLVADAYLSYEDPACLFVRPFSIRWLFGFGCLTELVPFVPTHDYDMLIEDANGTTVFDSREADSYTAELWGSRLRVHQWINTTDDAVLRVVQHIAWSADEVPENWPIYLEPTNGLLDERVSERLLPRVRSLRVDLGTSYQEAIRLVNGFNTELAVVEQAAIDGGRLGTVITVHADAGSGKGKFSPACDDENNGIRRINNINGDASGNFLLDATGCYRVERPVLSVISEVPHRQVQVRDNALQVSNDCGPCCECDDFINTYEGVRRLRNNYADLFERAQIVRDLYKSNLARFQASADCRQNDPLRVVIRPLCPDEIAIAIGYCNNTDECLRNLVIPISFTYAGEASPDVVCNSTYRGGNREENPAQGNSGGTLDFYQLGGCYPYYYAAWEQIDPGGLAQVTFRVNFSGSTINDGGVTVAVDAYSLSAPIVDAMTGADCEIPIPGYEPGVGPVGQEAIDTRLVTAVKEVHSDLFQEPCCPEESFSEA